MTHEIPDSTSIGPDHLASAGKVIWRMDPSPSTCLLYETINLKSPVGLKMIMASMDYEAACARAKIDFIETLKGLMKEAQENISSE